MSSASYFFDDGQSRKFWSINIRGKKQTIRHGRIGTQGRETTKTFPSASAAKLASEKLKDQKLAKGYVLVDPNLLKIKRPKGKRAATEAQVTKLEKRLGVKLPQEYRDFLRTQNGGEPEPNFVELPIFGKQDTRPIDFIYGLYAKPEAYKSLLFAEEFITPSLPEGHFPVCGQFNLYYYSISLRERPGCVYFWNEDAGGYDLNEHGDPVFDMSHAILVAGSFNEFLTRIAICQPPAEDTGAEESASDEPYERHIPELSTGKRLSKRRREEIIRLVDEGGEELTAVMEQSEAIMQKKPLRKSRKEADALVAKFLRKMDREIKAFLKTTKSKDELQYYAENMHWEANTRQVMELVKNPYIDAGTLLQIYWYACPEDYYFQYGSVSEIDSDFDRYIFRVLQHIEKRFLKSEYKSASFPFDPTSRISMWERRDEFERQIPDIMYEPIGGRKKRK